MTWFQLISSAIALLVTFYCVPAPWRKGERFTNIGMFTWLIAVAVAAVSWVGVK